MLCVIRLCVIYQALDYIKSHHNIYTDLSSNKMLSFSEMKPIKENLKTLSKKVTQNELQFSLIEDPLNMHRSGTNETVLVSEVPNIFDKENVIKAPKQEKSPLTVLNDDRHEELLFPCLFPKEKSGYNVARNIPISTVRYFNQRLLNF